ncbi:MAG: response regulator transcription factor [Colwellia sp.]|jgi:two-component system OmpR family response regulator|uniref:response regulator n=1 Tax=Alteromonas sp. MB-3u-76 TaxID=2058133 RepID=UPI0000336FC3|nr:response regulator transcription factor [Alteromonas sp. MB-3u-76]AUC87360.1 DNA-binding response regulator [Alteromonas sp. MB-3u-76]MBL1385430.1 response regulator transcription factor [Colwellia sp.]|tara:strand:- start:6035 stop:6712 length:678 start_codon:yes stop_codon:yes gene_type:complete
MIILLIEDDQMIADFIVKGLREAGFCIDHVANGQDGLDRALNDGYDLAILDIMLPGLDGLSIIERMRQHKIETPVIILSAKRSIDDRVRGLQSGGDDYLIKPFSFSELLARIQAQLRRANSSVEASSLTMHDLSLDLLSRTVTREGKDIELQPKEFALLAYLMRNAGNIVSKTMIMERVWNYNFDPQTNIVEARISKLREKVDKNFAFPLIHTIRGLGYTLKKAK